MVILLIGAPGSGKGTQSQILASKLGLPHLSTGDIFRKIVETDTEEGKLLKSYMDYGKLVPSNLVNEVVAKVLLTKEYEKGCLLDGYPRNIEQAEYLNKKIPTGLRAIYLDVDDEVVKQRILGRFSCAKCKTLYNKYFARPKIDNQCDNCGSKEFIYRQDDKLETIEQRLVEYKQQTTPLIEYYKQKGEFVVVDANKSAEEVTSQLEAILKIN